MEVKGKLKALEVDLTGLSLEEFRIIYSGVMNNNSSNMAAVVLKEKLHNYVRSLQGSLW